MTEHLPGLDLAALDRYLNGVGISRSGELHAELIPGGRSNLTFVVFDDESKWILRRRPLHGLTPSAHDVVRDYRVILALQGTAVPVAPGVTVCDDESVLGAPFAMVQFVAGQVIRSSAELDALGGPEVVDGCVDTLIRVLVDLHAVEPAAVGLSDFGRPEGYLERQVRRWGGQWQHVRLLDDRRDGDVQRLYSALSQSVPPQSRTSIVHGDYRIDNTILDTDDATVVRAVVDWEMSTLGDPLSDAALMCVYRDPNLDLIIDVQAAWTSPLVPPPDELAHRYALISGQPLANWAFYMSLAYFKLAIIAAGIHLRHRMADDATHSPSRAGETVAPLIDSGIRALKIS
jgi:aminoglycoside phosphotransferase (APT) family kinase protein